MAMSERSKNDIIVIAGSNTDDETRSGEIDATKVNSGCIPM